MLRSYQATITWKKKTTNVRWIAIRRPSIWTWEMLCITATGMHNSNTRDAISCCVFNSLCSNFNAFPFKADVELNCLWCHFAKIWCFHWDERCYWIYLSLCRTYLNVVIIKHCRAAAHSKLGNYTEATCDCERAIGIDPTYSKAYGRMGWVRLKMWGFVSLEIIPPPQYFSLSCGSSLALTAMNKYPEAISYFKKALVLDPENDTYKSNLKIAEQKHKEATSPVRQTQALFSC